MVVYGLPSANTKDGTSVLQPYISLESRNQNSRWDLDRETSRDQCRLTESIQPFVCSNPYVALSILQYRTHDIVAQTILFGEGFDSSPKFRDLSSKRFWCFRMTNSISQASDP